MISRSCFTSLLLLFYAPISFAFSSNLRTPKITRMNAAAAELDQEITKWCESTSQTVKSIDWVGSSDWASFRKVTTSGGTTYFVKTSRRSAQEMFEGEALGLQAMYECSSNTDDGLTIPKVHYWGDYISGSLLIMDFLELGGRTSDYDFGKAMARLHLAIPTEANGNPTGVFGFAIDNTIGGTHQPNIWTGSGTTNDWIQFYKKYRMEHQLQLAGDSACSKYGITI